MFNAEDVSKRISHMITNYDDNIKNGNLLIIDLKDYYLPH